MRTCPRRTVDPVLANNHADVAHQITDVADLSITKTGPVTVTAGTGITYTIRITNAGPSLAENTKVFDRLPGGIQVISATAQGGSCTTGTPGSAIDRLMCGMGGLGVGETRLITIVATVRPDVPPGTVLENDATVTSDIFDPNNANNFAFTLAAIGNGLADLGVTKLGLGTFVAGEVATYIVTVTNSGPSWATDVSLHDQLPTQVTFIDAYVDFENGLGGVPLACGINQATNDLTCALGTVPVTGAEPIRVTINVRVKPETAAGTVLTNCADIRATDSTDPNAANNLSCVVNTVAARADLVVTKSASNLTPIAGEIFDYVVNVVNNGPSVALNVVVTDTLPASVQYLTDTDACVQGPTGTLVCTLGTMLVGEVRTFTIRVRVSPAAACDTQITNTVTASSTVSDTIVTNNTATSRVSILCRSDLRVRKFGKPDNAVRAGDILTYTVIVDNLGPTFARSVALKDLMQASADFDLIDIQSDRRAVCRASTNGQTQAYSLTIPATTWPPVVAPPAFGVIPPTGLSAIDQRLQIDCQLVDDPATTAVNESVFPTLLADGPPNTGRWIVTMRVRARQTQSINNVASVLDNIVPDPNPANNEAAVEHEITDVADVGVTKSAVGEVTVAGCPPGTALTPNAVTAGLRITYTITVTNAGPSTAENVLLLDRLPNGIVVLSAVVSGGPGSCVTGMPGSFVDQLRCGLDTMLVGAVRVVTIVARVNANVPNGTILENDVAVTSDKFDNNNANNFGHNLTTVSTAADLSISKTDNPDPVVAGQNLNYTIRVTNTGPSDAQNVVVTDTLPVSTTFLSAIGAACVVDPINTNTVVCNLGLMPAGSTRVFSILVNVNPNAPALLTNTVVVGSETADPCAANNTGTAVTTVTRVENVFVTKTDSPDPVLAGTDLRYTVTFGNNGPSTATNVRITDTLPLGVTFLRCEAANPNIPNSAVACRVTTNVAGQQVVEVVAITQTNTTVWQEPVSPNNNLDPGESYQFVIVTRVSSGYVLDGLGDTGVGQACRIFFDATGYPHFASNVVRITSQNDAGATADNTFQECTRVNAEADVSVTKVDDALGFANCDPVLPGGMITYDLVVRNNGPSDAAVVRLNELLPQLGVALDPAQVVVTFVTGGGLLFEVRDDGQLILIVGRDVDRFGQEQLGRINAGRSVQIRIQLMVARTAVCGSVLTNTATVLTVPGFVARLNGASEVPPTASAGLGLASFWLEPSTGRLAFLLDVTGTFSSNITLAHIHRGAVGVNGPVIHNLFLGPAGGLNASAPVTGVLQLSAADVTDLTSGNFYVNVHTVTFPGGEIRGQIGRLTSPTLDPNTTNNTATATTRVECPSIRVNKTVSFNGQCPGFDVPIVNQPGQAVTFCFEVTNTGTTFLDTIRLVDELRTRMGPMPIAALTITSGLDPKVPLAPGETVRRQLTLPSIPWNQCGTMDNVVTVTANPVNSGRTDFPCLVDITATDTARIDITCAGLDYRLALPVLNSRACKSWVSVQNVGNQRDEGAHGGLGRRGGVPAAGGRAVEVRVLGALEAGEHVDVHVGREQPAAGCQERHGLQPERHEPGDDGRTGCRCRSRTWRAARSSSA